MRSSENIRIVRILKILEETYPDAKCSLDYKSPFQLLVATILSAQCTDKRVNWVTPALFKKYPNAHALAHAKPHDVEELIRSTGFYKQKAKSLLGSAQAIAHEHSGKVPQAMEELSKMPGVGRKTANVVLGNAFGKPDGMVVDTHVKRISYRLGLTKHREPSKVEKDLNALIPKEYWIQFPHWLIHHGRAICKAPRPLCSICCLNAVCPKKGVKNKTN